MYCTFHFLPNQFLIYFLLKYHTQFLQLILHLFNGKCLEKRIDLQFWMAVHWLCPPFFFHIQYKLELCTFFLHVLDFYSWKILLAKFFRGNIQFIIELWSLQGIWNLLYFYICNRKFQKFIPSSGQFGQFNQVPRSRHMDYSFYSIMSLNFVWKILDWNAFWSFL